VSQGEDDVRALLKRSLTTIESLKARLATAERAASEPIAIVGIGCRFPGGADGPAAFWRQLLAGTDAVTEIPPDRWDLDALYDADPDALGKTYSRWGAFLDGIDQFDPQFFGIAPREATSLDPQHRLLLEVTWEALEHAGIAPSSLAESQTAVYMGLTTRDYLDRQIQAEGLSNADAYTASGNTHSVAAGRLSYVLGLHGPNVVVDTACSSSLVAIHLAVQSLRNREAALALAGGVNVMLGPDGWILTSRARMASPTGRCHTFDAGADGYVRGEGCAVVVLKRLADAERDGDRVLALVRGSALNQDGRSSGLTAPNGTAQEAVIRAALANARVAPAEVGYVEAHGTGTSLGDPIEVKALAGVYGAGRQGPLMIGSVKTNIGHLEGAAGVAGLVKAVLALHEGVVPPHLHLRAPNPLIPWSEYPVSVPTSATPWVTAGKPRRAGVSSFGFSGTNAHVILEEAPARAQAPAVVRSHELLVLSAQTPPALAAQAARVASLLAGGESWSDVAASAALGRSHLPERLALVSADAAEAAGKLDAFATGAPPAGMARGRAGVAPEIAFLFTGQGAQYPGMGRALYQHEPVFRRTLDACAAVLDPLRERPLLSVMLGEDAALLEDTAYTQPALFALEYALCALWRSWGIEPTVVMGHSVGEYVAACVAGVFSLEDGLRLIAERGRLMSALPRDGAMAAVFAEAAVVERAIAGHPTVSVAAFNGPENTVISGRAEAVAAILARLAAAGITAQALKVSHAFHSPLMDPMLDAFETAAAKVTLSPPTIGLVSNLTGRLAGAEVTRPDYWRRHVREPVRFAGSIDTLQQEGYRVFLELGPTPVLTGMARRGRAADGTTWLPSLRQGKDDAATMLDSLGQLHVRGAQVKWGALFGSGRRRIDLPTYPFQRQRYWRTFSTPRTRLGPLRASHPLLGGALPSALPIYEAELDLARQAWLGDHRIFDVTPFPATGFLELVLAAAREAIGASDLRVEEVAIGEPLLLPASGAATVQVIVTPAGEGHAVKVHSREGSEGPWRLHASAMVARGAGAPEEPRPQPPGQAQSPEEYYAALDARGAHYGPSFRGLTELAHAGREASGRVRLPAALAAAGYRMHPALLDAGLQLIGAALAGSEAAGDMHVPVALDRYRLFRDGVSEARCRVAVVDDPAGGLRADLTMFDEAGTIAELRGLRLQRVSEAALRRASQRSRPDWLYEVAWRPAPHPRAPRPTAPGRWLVLSEGELGDAFAERLDEQGAQVEVLRRGDQGGLGERARGAAGVVSFWAVAPAAAFAPDQPAALLSSTLSLAQALAGSDTPLWLVTRGAQAIAGSLPDLAAAPAWALGGVIASEQPGRRCVRVDLDPAATPADLALLLDEVWAPDGEERIGYRQGVRHVARLAPALLAPVEERALRLEITARGSLDNLRLAVVPRSRPGAGQVELRVAATGLNFRDVLNALGMYPGDPGPLGNECAGVITAVGPGVQHLAVGDEVIAMVDRSFATWVVAPAALTVRKPASLDFAEAATIPVAYLTADYAFRQLAQLRPGERVLIHAITGGVGMAAAALARRMGAIIHGTAGTPAKRALARTLGAVQVGDSRSLSFEGELMAATGGQGVDVVLNALAGDFIPASLRVLRAGGRFVEIGKTGIWDAARVAAEFPGVRYHPLYLGEVAAAEPDRVRGMLEALLADLATGALAPLPRRVFSLAQAPEAFRFMAQGRHTGKVVIAQPPPVSLRADASYLVTGGLGGLGLSIARGMIDEGARHLVLVGRRAPSAAALKTLDELRSGGAVVVTVEADVADRDAMARLLTEVASTMPPLRGIVHAAGVLDDALLPQQSMARFEQVFAPKVRGAWNLHQLTARLPLDFFVMFSAAAAELGSPGQGNYAAANAFLDALARVRRATGLPALSIGWGSWAEVGMAAGVGEAHRRRWEAMGLAPIAPADGARLFAALLRGQAPAQVLALPLDRARLPATLGRLFEDLLVAAPRPAESAAGAMARRLAEAPAALRPELMVELVREEVAGVLGLGGGQAVPLDAGLFELGMDSLMSVELRTRLERGVGRPLPSTLTFNYPNVGALAAFLQAETVETVETAAAPELERPVPAPSDDLDALTEDELEARLLARLERSR
jgi:acyl transferase domain-containing protein/acyl carrier protein